MSGAITSILMFGVLILGGWYAFTHKDEIIAAFKLPAGGATASAKPSTTTPPTTSTGSCNPNLIKAISHPNDAGMRLKFGECITVTGTVVGEKEPHYAPDGDLVFALKLDPQFSKYVNSKNNAAKYQGGIWCEAVCQSKNNSKDSWHKGDCAQGGPFPKFPMPKRGDRLKVTGIHTIDDGEGGHAEIHPVSNIEILSKKSNFAYTGEFHYIEQPKVSYLYYPY